MIILEVSSVQWHTAQSVLHSSKRNPGTETPVIYWSAIDFYVIPLKATQAHTVTCWDIMETQEETLIFKDYGIVLRELKW